MNGRWIAWSLAACIAACVAAGAPADASPRPSPREAAGATSGDAAAARAKPAKRSRRGKPRKSAKRGRRGKAKAAKAARAKAERRARAARSERAARGDHGARTAARDDGADRAPRAAHANDEPIVSIAQAERVARAERADRAVDHAKHADRTERADRADRADRTDRAVAPAKHTDRADRTAQDAPRDRDRDRPRRDDAPARIATAASKPSAEPAPSPDRAPPPPADRPAPKRRSRAEERAAALDAELAPLADDPALGRADRIDGLDVKGYVAFTFDDGPSPATTPTVLATLRRYDVPAAFFIITRYLGGRRGARNRALVAQQVAGGFLVGSHSVSHRDLRHVSTRRLEREIDQSLRSLADAAGRPIGLFRPPFGSLGRHGRAYLARRGLTEVRWSIDPEDWRLRDPRELRRHTLDTILRNEGGVVLLHDAKALTAHSLALVLDDLEAANCRRLAARRAPILPVSLHYWLRDGGKPRAIPDDVKRRTDAYRAALPGRCAARGQPVPGEERPAPASPWPASPFAPLATCPVAAPTTAATALTSLAPTALATHASAPR